MFDGAPTHSDPAPGLDPDLALRLPVDAYYHLVRTLRLILPPPGPNPTPEDFARRDHAAIARIAALAPANAAEADLAAQFVAASEQWKDCLALAQAPETSPAWQLKCRAQALGMMRQSQSALRLLLRLQAARRKLEANTEACDRLAWTEHCALRLMAEALAQPPHPDPFPANAAEAAPSPVASGERQGEAAAAPDLIAAAERYAAAYPDRAAAIRRTGKLPSDVRYFDPPEAALARALITARTPALAALDALPEACPVPRHAARAA
jgi:hypothetical protein